MFFGVFHIEVRGLWWFSCSVNVLAASQHHTHAGVTQINIKYKVYHTLPWWWLDTAVKCTRRVADYHRSKNYRRRALPWGMSTTHGSMYQSGQSPSKKYRALPWELSTTVACTRVADYHSKNTVHYQYRDKCYTNLKNRYREEPWKFPGSFTNEKPAATDCVLEILVIILIG